MDEWDQKRESLREFFDSSDIASWEHFSNMNPELRDNMHDAFYSASEMCVLPIDGSLGSVEAYEIYRMVATVIQRGFPDELVM